MITYRGKWALVTGASSGIGRTFAEALAARGAHLVLAARSEDKLSALAQQLAREHGVDARTVIVDLSIETGAERLYQAIEKLDVPIDVLVNNAGFGTYGAFETLSADREQREILLNAVTPVRLAHLFIPAMIERGEGFVINVASVSSFQPTPYMAVYGATKAFLLSFSEALWAEYRSRNLRVLAVCPGPTESNFFTVVGSEDAAVGKKRTSDSVVRGALRALDRGACCYIDGGRNRLQTFSLRLAPRRVVALGAAAVMRPTPVGG